MSKGSKPRPFSDRAKFDSEFDRIFGQRVKETLNPSPSCTDRSEQSVVPAPSGE